MATPAAQSSASFATSELFPGQWRLARVEVANWGTFSGYHELPINRQGTLITGQSGSGKSTLLDAIAAVLTPPANLSLNAAANNGKAHDQGRSLSNYVRGAYGNTMDASGEIVHSYLRPRAATWSGILLQYEDAYPLEGLSTSAARQHEPVCLLAIFFQRANTSSNDGLSRFYAVLRGTHALSEFESYGRNGADTASFNKDYRDRGKAWKNHREFEARLCSVLHIQSSKTLVLLHKTQAAKNIGSLDDLFRTYMLERPRTFDLAKKAVEQFKELQKAHEGVVDQREQMECLEPLIECETRYEKARAENAATNLLEQTLPVFVEEATIRCLDVEIKQLQHRADELAEEVSRAQSEQRSAEQKLDAIRTSMSENGLFALEQAELQLSTAQKQLNDVRMRYQGLENELKVFESISAEGLTFEQLSAPSDRVEFEALKRLLSERTHEAEAWLLKSQDKKTSCFGELSKIQEQQRELQEELRSLRSRPSKVPRKLHEIRVAIAQHLGLSPADLPFMAELIDVKPQCHEWQGAIERLVGGRAKTMLAERRYAPAINEYLEAHHLGIRFDYDAVPDKVEVPEQPNNKDVLSRKVSVKNLDGHESLSRWTNKELRERFDYVCVEDSRQLEAHKRALSKNGHIKNKEHHSKDDRYRVDDRSQWVLGSSNEEKIEELETQVHSLETQEAEASRAAQKLTATERQLESIRRLEQSLRDQPWENYDRTQAEQDVKGARDYRETLAADKAIRKQTQVLDEAKERCSEANRAVEDAKVKAGRNADMLADAEQRRDKHRRILERERTALKTSLQEQGKAQDSAAKQALEEFHPEAHAQLLEEFQQVNRRYESSLDTIHHARERVLKTLQERARKAATEEQSAMREAEKTMTRYRERWQVEAADLSSDFEDREAYLARYRQIKASGLPEYERKFLDVLTSFSQDQITVIASEIRGAFREVRERLEPVNRSLQLSEYSPGIHLAIKVTENRNANVKRFLADLSEITKGSWEEDSFALADQRYQHTAAVMNRLASNESADLQWKKSVLDTSLHMKFTAVELAQDGSEVNVHSNDGGLSGGQKQKLVFFCLAAALRYQLADEDQSIPAYGTVILDEAFDKSDHRFAEEALGIFEKFGFHMVLATPGKLLQVADDHVGSIVVVSCEDQKRSVLSPITFQLADDGGADVQKDTLKQKGATKQQGATGQQAKTETRGDVNTDQPCLSFDMFN